MTADAARSGIQMTPAFWRALSAVLMVSMSAAGVAAASRRSERALTVRLIVGGTPKGTVRVLYRNNHAMVPFRRVMTALGWKVGYTAPADSPEHVPTVGTSAPFPDPNSETPRDRYTVSVGIGHTRARTFGYLNPSPMGEEITVHPAPFLRNGNAYVPLTFIQEALRPRFAPIGTLHDLNGVSVRLDSRRGALVLDYVYRATAERRGGAG